jgi:hypothetical protein
MARREGGVMDRKAYYAVARREAHKLGRKVRLRKVMNRLIPKLVENGLQILKQQSVMPRLVNRALNEILPPLVGRRSTFIAGAEFFGDDDDD